MSEQAQEAIRVLIVDDSDEDRYVYRRFLAGRTDRMFTIAEAATGAAALRMCADLQPDCMLLDYRLPDMSGIEVLQELAQDSSLKRTAVVMLTGHGNETVAVTAMKLGVLDYLNKNAATPEVLDYAISSAVEKSRLRRELETKTTALAESNRELERFACVVAHDLQNPLTSMTMFLSVLRRLHEEHSDAEVGRYIDMALETSDRMKRLIADLLEFSRCGEGRRSFHDVNCAIIAREARHGLKAALKETGARVVIHDLPTVRGHRAELHQVFQNLIENAIRYTDRDTPPVVEVSCQQEDSAWRFAVRDNGVGIRAEDHDRVFEPFERLADTADRPGNGLGLAICKKVVEYHGGEIGFDSTPAEGTTFWFTLPREQVQQARAG